MMNHKIKRLSAAEEALLTKEELAKYYEEIVSYYKKAPINLLYLAFVKLIRKALVKMAAKMGDYEIVYLNDLEVPEGGCIIATNHKGFNDLPILLEAVEEPFFVLAASDVPMPLMLRIIFKLLGAITLDRANKEEKEEALERASKISARGYTVAYYPEAVNNFMGTALLYHFWPGIIDNAKNANKPILPIATFDKDGKVYVRYGKPYKVNPWDNREIAASMLRDEIASLLWDIWEIFPPITREEAVRTYQAPGLTVGKLTFNPEYESQFIYRPKNPYSPDNERELTMDEVTDINRNIKISKSEGIHEIAYHDYKDFDL